MVLPPPQPPDTYPVNPDSSFSHFIVRQMTPSAITNTWPIQVTINDHGMSNGDVVQTSKFIRMPFANATGMEQLNNERFTVQQCTQNTFELYTASGYAVDGTNFTPYVQGGQFTWTGPRLPVENPSYPPPPGFPVFPPI